MKKIFTAVLALAAVVGCAKETLVSDQKEAITFDNAFVDKATRAAYDASYNNSNLTEFQVYGTITGRAAGEGTANIFNGEIVEKGTRLGQGDKWSYNVQNTQYWIPGNNYQFRAIADGNIDGATSVVAQESDKYMATKINVLDASKQRDILTAEHNITDFALPTDRTAPAPISFTFTHILSKAKFTVQNTIKTDNGYSYMVTDVALNDLAKNGVYTIIDGDEGTWAAAATPATYSLSFGDVTVEGKADDTQATVADIKYDSSAESNFDRLLIPGAQTLNISFSYGLYKDEVLIDAQDKTLTANVTLDPAKAYNFVISLGNPGEPIQFDVLTVTEWDENHTGYNPGLSM